MPQAIKRFAVSSVEINSAAVIPDVTKVLAPPDRLRLYMQPAVVALAEMIEGNLLNLYSQFTANAPVGASTSECNSPSSSPTDAGSNPVRNGGVAR